MTEALPPTIEWAGDRVRIIDQRRLPGELALVELCSVDHVCDAISTLAVRGAPALGVAGAMGVALAAVTGEDLAAAAARLRATRPTAVNLAWGVDRALAAHDPVAEAGAIAAEDIAANRALGAAGAALLADGSTVMTHCNAGALACAGYGTALGVIRAAYEQGTRVRVLACETRPVLQGARLTAWELQRVGVDVTVITDGMPGARMAAGDVDAVIVGADRVAANGDVVNKIGTYGLAVLAHHHGIPFYVAAPCSTIDAACATGAAVPIEQRAADEVATIAGARIVPDGVAVANPAFDVTPAALVTALVTESGVHRPPFDFSGSSGARRR